MIDSERNLLHEMVYIESEKKCVKCRDTRKITVYRNDLEEFEEINCDLCTLPD